MSTGKVCTWNGTLKRCGWCRFDKKKCDGIPPPDDAALVVDSDDLAPVAKDNRVSRDRQRRRKETPAGKYSAVVCEYSNRPCRG